jgi:hypothetical protein
MAHTPRALLDRLTQEEFTFNLRGWKEPAAAFFAPTAAKDEILAERCRWLAEDPARYLLHGLGSEEVIEEAVDFARQLDPNIAWPPHLTTVEQFRRLGAHWEPDIILCRKNASGRIVMEAGVVCFPSRWAPETRLGLPVETLHDPVPGLNAAIGAKIFNLLDRLPAGYAWLRLNWGLSASAERNQHLCRGLPPLSAATPPEAVWFRVEHQALVRLPATQGILFGIRVHSYPLGALRDHLGAARAVAGQLCSMPQDIRIYKGIQDVAERVANWLNQAT